MSALREMAEASLPLLLQHLASSTLFLLLVLSVILALRDHLTASGRFSLAFLGIVKFAIPAELMFPAGALYPAGSPSVLPVSLEALGGSLRVSSSAPASGLWPVIATALWLLIAAMLLLRFSLSRHRLVALALRTALPPASREVEALSRARRRAGILRGIDLARAAFPEAPAVLRIFRPLVVLPISGCDDLSDDELESLLRHECAHVARHDNLVARIESFVSAIFWFHPLIWIARRITSIERERACDEVVAGSADDQHTYLTALTKFCHAAITPGLPGVSCMATAKLKERMDYVMNYPEIKAQSPSARRLTFIGCTGLVLFTIASGIVGGDRVFATTDIKPYAIRISATRSGESVVLDASVTENESQRLIAAPKINFEGGKQSRSRSRSSVDGLEVLFDARRDGEGRVVVEVIIEKDGRRIQEYNTVVTPTEQAATTPPRKYTGDPITLALRDAALRDVLLKFGKITGLEITMDDAVQGKVSVNWQNVPWDEAFDTLLRDNGLAYRLEGSKLHVSKK